MEVKKLFQNDPFQSCYNLDGLDTVILTADIDWAPEYAIADLFELVSSFGFSMTAFATHESPVMRQAGSWLEIGLHPDNTRPHPEEGFWPKFAALKEMYPEAVGFRCHRNFFGNNISDLGKRLGLIYDASVVLWRLPFGQAYVDYNGIVRMSYCWEDGLHADLNLPMTLDEVYLNLPGLKILNVHPMLLYLNSQDDNARRQVTSRYKDLQHAPQDDVDPYVSKGYGLKSFYKEILSELKARGVRTLTCRQVAELGLKKA